jgi:tetratricopeptide (TPR) repeat protein
MWEADMSKSIFGNLGTCLTAIMIAVPAPGLLGTALIGLTAPSPVSAQEMMPDDEQLDILFAQLKQARSYSEGRDIADQIWWIWTAPQNDEISAKMREAMSYRSAYDLEKAKTILEQMTEDYPDYAESWNQLATLSYMEGEFEQSLIQIAETLAREPRHFGALAGRCLVYLKLDDRERALQSIIEALEIHPYLSEKQLFPELMNAPERT